MDAEEVRELARQIRLLKADHERLMKRFDELLARVDEVYYGRRPRPALTLVPHGGEVS